MIIRPEINEAEVCKHMYKLNSALKYMHSKNIIHRDLKLENVLFDHNPFQGLPELKIVDFGLGAIYMEEADEKEKKIKNKLRKQSYVGTPLYCSPEVVKNTPYDYKTDVWSMGVMMYVLLTG